MPTPGIVIIGGRVRGAAKVAQMHRVGGFYRSPVGFRIGCRVPVIQRINGVAFECHRYAEGDIRGLLGGIFPGVTIPPLTQVIGILGSNDGIFVIVGRSDLFGRR